MWLVATILDSVAMEPFSHPETATGQRCSSGWRNLAAYNLPFWGFGTTGPLRG